MALLHASPETRARRGRFTWQAIATTSVLAALTLVPAPAQAADYGVIEDEGLAHCVNTALKRTDLTQEITDADLLDLPQQFRCFSGPGVRSFAGIEGASRVLSMTFSSGNDELTSADALTPLKALPMLGSLTFRNSHITNEALTGLAAADAPPQRLHTLRIESAFGINDLSPLAHIPTLKTLELRKLPALTDLGPLANLSGLTELDLTDSRGVSDLTPIGGLTEISELSISNTSASDLGPLAGVEKLRVLRASNAGISSLEPLRELTRLQQMWVQNNELTSLAGLENLSDLRALLADNNQIAGGVDELAGKPLLTTLHVRNNQITSLAALADSTELTSLETTDNRISSTVGVRVGGDGISLRVLSQGLTGPEQFVPEGAASFLVDATGQASLRDGETFPALSYSSSAAPNPVADPELPLLRFANPRNNALEYEFSDDSDGIAFSGWVTMPITWSKITSVAALEATADVPLSHQVAISEGFPAVEYALGEGAPDWLSIDPQTGLLTGTAPAAGTYTVPLRVPDALGNALTQDLVITATALNGSTVEIGRDQLVNSGETLTFTVSREEAAEDPWTGAASVMVSTQDGTAVAGTDYRPVEARLVWQAGDANDKTVEVSTLQRNAAEADVEKTLILRLSAPGAYTGLGDRTEATGKIVTQGTGQVIPPTKPGQGGVIAATGDSGGTIPWLASGAMLLVAGAGALIARRMRRDETA